MAWNQTTSTPKKAPTRQGLSSFVKGILALIVVCTLGGLVWWFVSSSPVEKEKKARTGGEIAEVKPAQVKPKEVPVEVAEVKPIDPNARPTKVGETLNGYIKLPSGRLHRVKGVITNSVSATQFKGRYEIFDYHCENEIACLLTMRPGEGLVGTPRYNGRFKKEFLESLKTPIVVSAEDSPEDQELKRNVIQAKIELKEALDRGEDIEQIMLDTRKEYQDLARYKMELQELINEYKKDEGVTDEDVEDFVQAANKKLEEKGIAPLNVGPITRQKIRMMRLQQLNGQQ